MNSNTKHLTEYLVIITLSIVFLTLFVFFRFDREVLKLISAFASSFYVLWGIIHAALESRLNRLIVFEYLLFGILVFLLLYTALSF